MSLPAPSKLALTVLALGVSAVGLTSCLKTAEQTPDKTPERLNRVELRLQQLEQRLAAPARTNPADPAGKPPAGVVKSLTFRMGSQDDRLRIYWADGSSSDLPCTKEQGTWVCG